MDPGLLAYGIVCFIMVIFFTAYMVWRYARPGCAPAALFLTYISWLIVFSICFLVPIDLVPNASNSLNEVWTVLFWCSFMLMWVIIPFASGYYENGGFTVKHKLWMSLKFNAVLLMVAIIILGVGITYLVISASWGVSDVSGLLICVSNTWGLTMLVLCAGFGLVEFPRSIFYMSDYVRRKDYIYFHAAGIDHEAQTTKDELAATIPLIEMVTQKVTKADNEKHLRWSKIVNQIVLERQIELEQSKYRPSPISDFNLRDEIKNTDVITTNQMFRLHHHVKTLVRHLSLVETQWRDTVNDAVQLEKELKDQADPHQLSWWLKTGRRKTYMVLAALMAILVVFLVIGEITIAANTAISPLSLIVNAVQGNFVAEQLWTAIPLTFLSACTYYPLFQLRLSKLYYIGRKRTDEGTLLFNATFLLRVATPLAYNFVQLLHLPQVSLQNFVGVVSVIPFFGGSFTTVFPVFIAVLNILVLFNVFSRIGACLNIDSFKFAVVNRVVDEDVQTQMKEGRTLIQNELRRREKEMKAARALEMTSSQSKAMEESVSRAESEEHHDGDETDAIISQPGANGNGSGEASGSAIPTFARTVQGKFTGLLSKFGKSNESSEKNPIKPNEDGGGPADSGQWEEDDGDIEAQETKEDVEEEFNANDDDAAYEEEEEEQEEEDANGLDFDPRKAAAAVKKYAGQTSASKAYLKTGGKAVYETDDPEFDEDGNVIA